MQLVTKEKALSLLKKTIDTALVLPREYNGKPDYQEWEAWERTTMVRIEAIFGSDSQQANEIYPHIKKLKEKQNIRDHKNNLIDSLIALLKSFYAEVDDLWTDEGETNPVPTKTKSTKSSPQPDATNKRVFIVHGHDHLRMQTLARFLEKLSLEAIILHEQASQGSTVIEKLESHGDVGYAVVLLTPDDVGSTAKTPEDLRPRARQNVVLELGYFMARLGRRRTCALVAEGVEIPSDYSGVVYINIDNAEAWKFHLAKELKAAGLPVDINNAL